MRIEMFWTAEDMVAVSYCMPWQKSGLVEFESEDDALDFIQSLGVDIEDYYVEEVDTGS